MAQVYAYAICLVRVTTFSTIGEFPPVFSTGGKFGGFKYYGVACSYSSHPFLCRGVRVRERLVSLLTNTISIGSIQIILTNRLSQCRLL